MSAVSISRAFAWLIIGVGAGLAFVFLLLFSYAVFEPNTTEKPHLPGSELVAFLIVALMSGAGADFLLSVNFRMGDRWAVFLVVVVIGFAACYFFSPAGRLREDLLDLVNYIFCVIGFVYCIWVKSLIFEEERVAKKRKPRY